MLKSVISMENYFILDVPKSNKLYTQCLLKLFQIKDKRSDCLIRRSDDKCAFFRIKTPNRTINILELCIKLNRIYAVDYKKV